MVLLSTVAAPLLPDGIRCKYPHCNKRRYQEDSGKMHEFCGRFHATEFAKLGNQDGGKWQFDMQKYVTIIFFYFILMYCFLQLLLYQLG